MKDREAEAGNRYTERDGNEEPERHGDKGRKTELWKEAEGGRLEERGSESLTC